MNRGTRRSPSSPPLLAVACLALASVGCSSGGAQVDYARVSAVPGDDVELFTILHLFEAGRQSVERRLSSTGAEGTALRDRIERVSRAVVRVNVRWNITGSSFTSENGSGVLVADGRYVVTAGHVVDVLGSAPDAEVRITLVDGKRLRARATARDSAAHGGARRDWAVLEVVDALPPGFPSLDFAEPRSGGSVVLLGYPAHVGIRPDGRLAYDTEDAPAPLAPQVMLGRVEDAGGVGVMPLVGCIPEGGMSGGPVVDDAGRLVAVLSSVSHTRSGGGVRFLVEAASLERAAAWLAEERGR